MKLKSGKVTALKIMQNIRIQMKYRHKKVLSFNFDSDYIDTVFFSSLSVHFSILRAYILTGSLIPAPVRSQGRFGIH